MQRYKHYKTIDFLSDDDFIDWVQSPQPASDLYWQEVLVLFPLLEPYASEARRLLLNMKIKPLNRDAAGLKETIIAAAWQSPGLVELPKFFVIPKFTSWIAAALVLMVLGYWIWKVPTYRSTKLAVASLDGAGSKQVKNTADIALLVALPDESTVVLQPEASLTYCVDSFMSKREVQLVGNAFFDVSKRMQAPFIVHTDQLSSTVLGTSFFVDARPNIASHSVLVTSGAVRVKGKEKEGADAAHHDRGLVLQAGEETRLFGDRTWVAVPSAHALHLKEDLGKAFDFENSPMREVAEVLQAHYGVSVQIKDPLLEERPITAFLGNVSLQEKLSLIAKAVEAYYQLEDGIIIFTLNINQQ